MWQDVELLHSHLHWFGTDGLKKPLTGTVQATGEGGLVPLHGAIVDPGGDWTFARPTESTMSQSPTERTVALTDSMELRSALEILDGTTEIATRGILMYTSTFSRHQSDHNTWAVNDRVNRHKSRVQREQCSASKKLVSNSAFVKTTWYLMSFHMLNTGHNNVMCLWEQCVWVSLSIKWPSPIFGSQMCCDQTYPAWSYPNLQLQRDDRSLCQHCHSSQERIPDSVWSWGLWSAHYCTASHYPPYW